MISYQPRKAKGDVDKAQALAGELGLSMVTARLLCARGWDEPQGARKFLSPQWEDLGDAFLFEDMYDAADCINAALVNQELICVYGDYDVDGVCAVALLTRYLVSQGGKVLPYIPLRHNEGYGVNKQAIRAIYDQGATLLITVDCGVTALEEIAFATRLGMEVVVTDHHQCLERLPQCSAVINPARGGYPFGALCGAGVALKVVQALGGAEAALEYADLAALATVADIVSLTGENRVIVTAGLERINRGRSVAGIKALIECSSCSGRPLEAQDISFNLAPRINAAGRTGSTETSLSLFLTDDMKQARSLAQVLDEENKRRQAIESAITGEIEALLAQGGPDVNGQGAIVLCGQGWNTGVVGIAASKLVDKYHKPVFLLCAEGDVCTGSGRSIPGLHLFEALTALDVQYVRYGGHEMAAGLTLKLEDVGKFKAELNGYIAKNLPDEAYIKREYYDLEAAAEEIDQALCQSLEALAPYGVDNPAPVLRVKGFTPAGLRVIGNDQTHLSFNAGELSCVYFRRADRLEELTGRRADMLCTAQMSQWRGNWKVKCVVKQLRAELEQAQGELEKSGWKFHDALLANFLYNDRVNGLGEPGGDAEYGDVYGELRTRLREKCKGALLLAFTPRGAGEALAFLKGEGLEERVEVKYFGCADVSAYNTAVFAPKLEECHLDRYQEVYVADDAPDGRTLERLAAKGRRVVVAGRWTEEFLKGLQADREEMKRVYSAMYALGKKETKFYGLESYIQSVRAIAPAEEGRVVWALRVFEELEFIQTGTKGALTVKVAPKAQHRELPQSQTYRRMSQALYEYNRLQAARERKKC